MQLHGCNLVIRAVTSDTPMQDQTVLSFQEKQNVCVYLFNDMILIATHVKVQGIIEM